MRSKILGLLAVGLLAGPVITNATIVDWTLDNVTTVGTSQFHLGVVGSLTGSFSYDADTNTFSDILIRNTPNTLDPTPLTFSTFVNGNASSLFLYNGPPDPDGSIGRFTLLLNFANPLSNAGGAVPIASGTVTYFTGVRTASVTGGSVNAVPEPGTLALLGLGLAGLGLSRRRKAA